MYKRHQKTFKLSQSAAKVGISFNFSFHVKIQIIEKINKYFPGFQICLN